MKSRTSFLALAITALCLATGWAVVPRAQASSGARHGSTPIAIRALAWGGYRGAGLNDAEVVVRSAGRVVARGRTGSRGGALLRARSLTGGGNLRVIVSGGRIAGHRFRGRMVSTFDHYHWPQTVYVDSVTTLTAGYAAARPDLSRRRVDRRVHRFLRLPGEYRIGMDGRTNISFDGGRLLAAAGPTGYDAFIAQLVEAMSRPGTHRAFPLVPGTKATASALGDTGDPETLSEVAEAISTGTGFFQVLDKANEVLDFADAIEYLTHSENGASKAEIEAISDQLKEIQQSIAVVQKDIGRVEEQAAKRSYSNQLREMRHYSEAVREAESTLSTVVEFSIEHGCASPDPERQKCAEIEGMLDGHGGLAQQIEEGELGGPVGLNTYGGKIAGEAGPNGLSEEEGIVQAGSEMITDRVNGYFDTEDSQRVRAIAAYWVSNFAEAVAVAPVAWALGGDNTATLEHAVSRTRPMAEVMPTLVPQAVPQGTVLALQDGWMWSTAVASAGADLPSSWFQGNGPWQYVEASGRWVSQAGPTLAAIEGPGAGALPYANWQMATRSQLAALVTGTKTGEGLIEATGLEQGILTPSYQQGQRGIEEYWQSVNGTRETGCGGALQSTHCFWPAWAGAGEPVTNLNGGGTLPYLAEPEEENEFPGELPPDYWWGLRSNGTLYGSAPIERLPMLMVREVQSGNCYYYPGAGAPTVGSPGCPGQ